MEVSHATTKRLESQQQLSTGCSSNPFTRSSVPSWGDKSQYGTTLLQNGHGANDRGNSALQSCYSWGAWSTYAQGNHAGWVGLWWGWGSLNKQLTSSTNPVLKTFRSVQSYIYIWYMVQIMVVLHPYKLRTCPNSIWTRIGFGSLKCWNWLKRTYLKRDRLSSRDPIPPAVQLCRVIGLSLGVPCRRYRLLTWHGSFCRAQLGRLRE